MLSMRHLMRIGSAAMLTGGALTLTATPALAADVDFGVEVSSTTAAGVTMIEATITNRGTTTPDKLTVSLDVSSIDPSQAETIGPCDLVAGVFTCEFNGPNEGIPGPGKSLPQRVVFWRPAGSTPGPVGDLTATVAVEGDGEAANNTKSIPVVTAADRAPALRVQALEVTAIDLQEYSGKPLAPGAKSTMYATIANYGATTATGVRTVTKVPEDVHFVTDKNDNCDFSADKRTATCTWTGDDDSTMRPFIFDEELDKFASSFRPELPFVVDSDAKGPATLTGGEWTVTPLGSAEPKLDAQARSAALNNAFYLRDRDLKPVDHAEFKVRIGAAATGGGNGTGGGDDGGGSDEPSLPITGPGASTMLGTGSALVALGAFLAYASRRRRTS